MGPERRDSERNVYLIGQPGAGKTTLGRIAADSLGWRFFDMDEEVERVFGKDLDALKSEFLTDHSYRAAKVEGLLAFAKEVGRSVIAVSSDCVRVRRACCPIYIGGRELTAAEKKKRHKSLLRQGISLYKWQRPFYERADHTLDISGLGIEDAAQRLRELVFHVTCDQPST